MESVLITSKDKQELNLIKSDIRTNEYFQKNLTHSEKEDVALLQLMLQAGSQE